MTYKLTIGKKYMATTASGAIVIPILEQSKERAIFVTDAFPVTPFVSWQYHLTSNSTIELAVGTYYRRLQDIKDLITDDDT